MEPDANESLLSFDVSVPKPLGKISFTSTFDAATQIHYRPSIVLLSDIISDENVRSITSNTHGLQGDDEAEETTEDDDVDVEEESEDDLNALIEEATEVVKRFDPHQELRDKVANFKKERRRELEQEILSKTGDASLSDENQSEIRKRLQVDTAAFLKQQDAAGDLDWYLTNIVQQPVKDELYHSVSEMYAFADFQGYPNDHGLLEAMLTDSDSLGFLGLAPEVMSATPTKKEKTDMEKRAFRLEAIKKVFGDVIFGEYSKRNQICIGANQFGEALTPSDWKELTDAVQKSRKDLLETLEEGRHNDSLDCVAFHAALETRSEAFIVSVAYLYYARILGFWRERQSIAAYLNSPDTIAKFGNGDKKEWQKKEEYHLLHLVLESLAFFEDLIRDYLDTIDNFAVDIFESNEMEQEEAFSDFPRKGGKKPKKDEDDEDEDDEMEEFDEDDEAMMNSITFLPPFPGEDELFDDEEEDEEGDDDDEEEDELEDDEEDEEDEDDLSEAEEVDDEDESSPFESPIPSKSKKSPAPAAKRTSAVGVMASVVPKSNVTSPAPAVDPHFPNLNATHRVYQDSDGCYFSVLLNMSDPTGMNSKFFVIQVVTSEGKFYLFSRWGRADDIGNHQAVTCLSAVEAEKMFAKKFKDKTANDWSRSIQDTFSGRPGKYVCIFPSLVSTANATPAPATPKSSARSPAPAAFGALASPSKAQQPTSSNELELDQYMPEAMKFGARLIVDNSQGQHFVWSVELAKGGSATDVIKMQLIQTAVGSFAVYIRIGSQTAQSSSFPSLQEAKDEFCRFFRTKTGNEWSYETALNGFSPIPGLYSMPLKGVSNSMPNVFTGAQPSPSSSLPKRLKRAPVDKMCPDAAQYEVYVDDTGLAWDACLNKVNISMNNNLFYFLQLLTTTAQSQFFVWSRWGRVGERGQSKLQNCSTIAEAKAQFSAAFMKTTGLPYSQEALSAETSPYQILQVEHYDYDEVPASAATPAPWFPPSQSSALPSGSFGAVQHVWAKSADEVVNTPSKASESRGKSPATTPTSLASTKTKTTPAKGGKASSTNTPTGSASKKQKASDGSVPAGVISFRTLNVFSQTLQKCTLPPATHIFNALVEGDVRVVFLQGYTNSEAAISQLKSHDVEALELVSASGAKMLVAFKIPRIVSMVSGADDDAEESDEESGEKSGGAARSNGDNSPSLHEIITAMDTIRMLTASMSPRAGITDQQSFDQRLALAKTLFGDATRALLYLLVSYHIPKQVTSPTSTDILAQTQPGARHLPPLITTIGSAASPSGGQVDLMSAIISFYGRVYHWTERAGEWTKDKSEKHARQVTVSKTEHTRCAKKYGPSAEAILPSLAQFVVYPKLA